MATQSGELWQWMEEQTADAPERGLQILLLDIVEQIEQAMGEQDLTRAEVGRRAGLKREYVSRILNNPSNVTVASLVRLANAVSRELCMQLKPRIELLSMYDRADPDHREATYSDVEGHKPIPLAA